MSILSVPYGPSPGKRRTNAVELCWLEVAGTFIIRLNYLKFEFIRKIRLIKIVPATLVLVYTTKTFMLSP